LVIGPVLQMGDQRASADLNLVMELSLGQVFQSLLPSAIFNQVGTHENLLLRAPRELTDFQKLYGHQKAAKEAAEQNSLISKLDWIAISMLYVFARFTQLLQYCKSSRDSKRS
jgi:hypothetical protein